MRTQTSRGARDQPRVALGISLGGATAAPCNLATSWGWYFRGDVRSGRVWVRRAQWFVPPFDLERAASPGPDDRAPCLLRDWRERLWCLWQVGESGVSQAYSDDEGETWNTPEVLFPPPAKHPRGRVCSLTGFIARAAYLSGAIVVRIQAPGESTPRAQQTVSGFGSLADDAFDLDWDHSGTRRLIFTVNTGSGTEEYVSTDVEDDTAITVTLVPS